MTTERADPLGEDYRTFVQRRAAPLHRTAYLLCGDWHVADDLDNYVWENSMDAIVAGSGNPRIRAGVLRLLATLPGITVTHDTTAGQPTLVIAAGQPEVAPGRETWIINANTGVPVKFLSGDPSKPDATIDYSVSRVSLADVKAGRF
jgi:hypothetical protein